MLCALKHLWGCCNSRSESEPVCEISGMSVTSAGLGDDVIKVGIGGPDATDKDAAAACHLAVSSACFTSMACL